MDKPTLRTAIEDLGREIREGGRPWAEVGHELGELSAQAQQQGEEGLVQKATWWQAEAYYRTGESWAAMLGGFEGRNTKTAKEYLEKALGAATQAGHGRAAMASLLCLARLCLLGERDLQGAQHYLAAARRVAGELAGLEEEPYAEEMASWQEDMDYLAETVARHSGSVDPNGEGNS